ncbi:MAG: hypothetical protein RR293_05865 [Bacteroidales bacterium]
MKENFSSAIEKSGQLHELLKLIDEGGENAPHLLYDLAIEKCEEIATLLNTIHLEKNYPEQSINTNNYDQLSVQPENNDEVVNTPSATENEFKTEIKQEDKNIPDNHNEFSASHCITQKNEETDVKANNTFQAITISTKPEMRHKKIREVICINDIFLFKRELFNNDEKLMNTTFAAIDETQSFEEAEKKLSELFNWDTEEDSFAADFMQKVENRFN